MKRSAMAAAVVALLIVVGGVTFWVIASNASHTHDTMQPSSNAVDMTGTKEVAVTIRDLSFSPPAIKVKKGAKVTWTNQDSVGHNAIADDAPDTGGLPTTNALLSRGQTESVTFVRVGTFSYHCSAHAFMRGSVQVVD
jgi:plastocyanin